MRGLAQRLDLLPNDFIFADALPVECTLLLAMDTPLSIGQDFGRPGPQGVPGLRVVVDQPGEPEAIILDKAADTRNRMFAGHSRRVDGQNAHARALIVPALSFQ